MKIALDPDYLIDALKDPNSKARIFLKDLPNGSFKLVISAPLFHFYETELLEHKKELKLKYGDIQNILSILATHARAVKLHPLWRPVLKKPGRDILMATACFGRADALLVSEDSLHFYKKMAKRLNLPLLTDIEVINTEEHAA